MPTVLRAHGLRVVIYTDDHPPPHVHVIGAGETKIALDETASAVVVVWTVGASFAEARRALRLVQEERMMLLERWNRIHG